MKTFQEYLESAGKYSIDYIKGNTYQHAHLTTINSVKYLGTKSDPENQGKKVNSTLGDVLTDPPVLIFQWLTGTGVPSSHGRKGDLVAFGKRYAKKHVTEN